MITYENSFSMQQYISRLKDDGAAVRKSKREILGIGGKALVPLLTLSTPSRAR